MVGGSEQVPESFIVSAWLYALITIAASVLGVILNYFLVSALTKKKLEAHVTTETLRYQERVERLTKEVDRYEDAVEKQRERIETQEKEHLKAQIEMYKELARYGRMIAAMSGKANGVDFREET
jgi:membrane protein YqaA with SNARE-associated domain